MKYIENKKLERENDPKYIEMVDEVQQHQEIEENKYKDSQSMINNDDQENIINSKSLFDENNFSVISSDINQYRNYVLIIIFSNLVTAFIVYMCTAKYQQSEYKPLL